MSQEHLERLESILEERMIERMGPILGPEQAAQEADRRYVGIFLGLQAWLHPDMPVYQIGKNDSLQPKDSLPWLPSRDLKAKRAYIPHSTFEYLEDHPDELVIAAKLTTSICMREPYTYYQLNDYMIQDMLKLMGKSQTHSTREHLLTTRPLDDYAAQLIANNEFLSSRVFFDSRLAQTYEPVQGVDKYIYRIFQADGSRGTAFLLNGYLFTASHCLHEDTNQVNSGQLKHYPMGATTEVNSQSQTIPLDEARLIYRDKQTDQAILYVPCLADAPSFTAIGTVANPSKQGIVHIQGVPAIVTPSMPYREQYISLGKLGGPLHNPFGEDQPIVAQKGSSGSPVYDEHQAVIGIVTKRVEPERVLNHFVSKKTRIAGFSQLPNEILEQVTSARPI